MRTARLALATALGLAACGPSVGGEPPPELADALAEIRDRHPRTEQRRIWLVALESCDPVVLEALVRQGKLPTFARMRREGARGQLECLAPLEAASTWTTLGTGVPPEVHGIFAAGKSTAEGTEAVRAGDRQAPTAWELAAAAGVRSTVIGWPLGWRGESSPTSKLTAVASSWDPTGGPARGRHSSKFGGFPLDACTVQPGEIGDDRLRAYADADAADVAQDAVGAAPIVRRALARAESVRRVCIDALRREDAPRLLAVRFQAIDEISRVLMPYAPPRLREVPLETFRRYRSGIEAVYGWHDRLLAELLALADEHTTVMVVSPHGFKSGDGREKGLGPDSGARWHRPWGTFLAWGGGVAAGVEVAEARATAVAPTVLAALGLPLPEAMDGRVLDEAFEAALPAVRVAGYPDLPTGRGPAEPESPLHPDAELRGRVARLFEKGAFDEAADVLGKLVGPAPAPWMHQHLARAQIELGRERAAAGDGEGAREMAERARDHAGRGLALSPDDAEGHSVMAEVLVVFRELDAALEHAQTAVRLRPRHHRAQNVLARVHRGRVLTALEKEDPVRTARRRHQVIGAYDRSLDIEPRQMDALVRSAEQRLLLAGPPAEQDRRAMRAIADLKLAVGIRPADRDALNRLAVGYLRRGELAMGANRIEDGEQMLKNALETVERALAADREHAAAWANKAYITYALWRGAQTEGEGFPRADQAVAMDLWEQCNESWARAEALQPGYPFNAAWLIRRTNSEYALKGKPLPVPPPKPPR